jgi:hypothetical protein
MLALLFAVALIALTILALLLAGALAAVLTGIALLNVFATILRLRACRPPSEAPPPERWRPSSFRRPLEPPFEADEFEADEQSHPLTIYRQ